MATTDYLARKARVGLRLKSAWGIPGDLSAADTLRSYLLIDPAQMKSNPQITREEMQLTSATGLTPERARSVTDYTSGLHKLGFGGVAFQDTLPYLLFLSLFKATETDLTVPDPDNFQQVFVPWGDTGIPDFTDPFDPASSTSPNIKVPSANIIFDWLTTNVGGTVLNDAIINTLNLNLNVNNQGIARFLQVSGEFVGTSIVKNFNSTSIVYPVATPALTTYNNATAFTFTLAGTVSYTGCFKTWGLSINNNVTSDCRTTGGRANNFRIDPEIMVDFTIPVNETTDTLAGGLLAGTEQTITLSTGTTQTLGYLNIVAKGALVNNLEPVIENGVWVYKGQLKCELPSSGNSLAVTMCSLTSLLVTP